MIEVRAIVQSAMEDVRCVSEQADEAAAEHMRQVAIRLRQRQVRSASAAASQT